MNIFILIILFLAFLGLFDKIIGNKLGFVESFDRGIQSMGTLAMSMMGFYCIAVMFVSSNTETILSFSKSLSIDASCVIGCLLAPDLGGYSIVQTLCSNDNSLIFTGLIITSTIGTVISFQLPLFLTSLEKDDIKPFIQGLIYGMIVVPVILIPYGLLLNIQSLFHLLIPVFAICGLLVLGLLFLRKQTISFLTIFGEAIRVISLVLFAGVILQAYFTDLPLTTLDLIEEAGFIVLKCSMIVSGSMILCDLIMKYCQKLITYLKNLLGVNKYAILGLFLQLATSVAMFPLFKQMDNRGKIINAAFSVSGAYVLGAQLGFISAVTTSSGIMIYITSKLIGGLLGIIVALIFTKKEI